MVTINRYGDHQNDDDQLYDLSYHNSPLFSREMMLLWSGSGRRTSRTGMVREVRRLHVWPISMLVIALPGLDPGIVRIFAAPARKSDELRTSRDATSSPEPAHGDCVTRDHHCGKSLPPGGRCEIAQRRKQRHRHFCAIDLSGL